MTFVQNFASQIAQVVATKNTAVICQELISVFQQAKTFHQFHEAWLKFESFKYFHYNQNHHNETFSVFIENAELQDEESPNFGLNLIMIFSHNYLTLSADSSRINYNQVINSTLSMDEFDISKFSFQ
jgi:hypothetical protein